MSFQYNKNGRHGDGESFWTSNSDLFLGLSSIFLLLYVVSSLRSGADGVHNATENKRLKTQIQDLENQLKTYESVKQQYLQTQANKEEKDEYNELMDKLTLLQQEANKEKDDLQRQANENARKEVALNKYQQMVRNIINANKLAKTKISNRDEVIVEKEEVIDEKNEVIVDQKSKIANLNEDVEEKENLIRTKDAQIDQTQAVLEKKKKELLATFKKAKMSQQAYKQRLKQLQAEADQKLDMLEEQREQASNELNSTKKVLTVAQTQLQKTISQLENTKGELDTTKGQLSSTKGQLDQTMGALDQTQGQLNATKGALDRTKGDLEKKSQEVSELSGQLSNVAAETKAKMDALKGKFDAERAAERGRFEAEMRKQKGLSEAEIGRREAAFRAAADAKERKLAGEMAGLAGQLKNTEAQLNEAKSELQARKKIASEIKQGFAKLGVKADINDNGDVLIDFGQAYFDSDSAKLKEEMQKVLQKAMPVYSKSLFGNPNVANQISAVEIIGFASPTYQGRFINPKSTRKEDLQAIKYNMDLSYKRAKSIFNYILDENEMDFDYRKELVPNLKVSGRSFLELMKLDRSVASAEDYCKKNDCKKSQRVIIKFSMEKK